jgi:hypothetical protein
MQAVRAMMDKVIRRVIIKAKNRARERERNRKDPKTNRARANAWRLANPERKRKADAKNYEENKATRKESMRAYGLAHRPELYAQRKLQRQNDSQFHLAEKLRGTLGHALRKRTAKKGSSTLNLLGCSFEEFDTHIDNQLLPNEDVNSIELDHIFPFRCFDLHDVAQQACVQHFSNTQPLSQPENRNKSDKLPTKAMAAKVDRAKWPPGVTEDMLPDIYPGWATPLRM